MSKKIIYIAGPMTGLQNFNYHSFYVAQHWLESQGWEVRNPATFPHNWSNYEHYIKCGLAILECCDCFCLLPGADSSKGATIERKHAAGLGIKRVNPFNPDIWSVLINLYNAAVVRVDG